MGKASSKKKVARAAKAGGSRARSAGERNVVFPFALSVVVVLGLALVVYARNDRITEVQVAPISNVDHWHSALGLYVCDDFIGDQAEFLNPVGAGTHTHGDGLLHIHPFSESRSGKNATLENYFDDANMKLSDDAVEFYNGSTFTEGEDTCGGEDAIVQVAYFDEAAVAADASPVIITRDFGDIRFLSDREAFTVAFAPEGADIPLPPSASGLNSVSPTDLGPVGDVDGDGIPDGDPDDGTTDTSSELDGETTDDTATDGESTDGETSDGETTDDTATDGETTDSTEETDASAPEDSTTSTDP